MLFELSREELVFVTDGLRRWVADDKKELSSEPPALAAYPDSVTARLLRGRSEKMDKLADRLWRDAGKMSDGCVGWGVFVNSDLTEGRGFDVLLGLCRLEATALRIAKRANVQGSDGVVRKVQLCMREGKLCGPIQLKEPSAADEAAQVMMDKKRLVREKAEALGLSTEDLDVLSARS